MYHCYCGFLYSAPLCQTWHSWRSIIIILALAWLPALAFQGINSCQVPININVLPKDISATAGLEPRTLWSTVGWCIHFRYWYETSPVQEQACHLQKRLLDWLLDWIFFPLQPGLDCSPSRPCQADSPAQEGYPRWPPQDAIPGPHAQTLRHPGTRGRYSLLLARQVSLHHILWIYSRTCLWQPSKENTKSGLCRQVPSVHVFMRNHFQGKQKMWSL